MIRLNARSFSIKQYSKSFFIFILKGFSKRNKKTQEDQIQLVMKKPQTEDLRLDPLNPPIVQGPILKQFD